jgi:hypothetical protein
MHTFSAAAMIFLLDHQQKFEISTDNDIDNIPMIDVGTNVLSLSI